MKIIHSNKSEDLSYQVYTDFRDSNWYIYWDKLYAHIKPHQLLVVWHITQDSGTNFDYITLKNLITDNTVKNVFSYADTLNNEDFVMFLRICSEFIDDMDSKFGK